MLQLWYRIRQWLRLGQARTVRYLFTTAIGAALLLGATAFLSEDASYVYLESATKTVAVGDRVTLQILAKAHTPVNAASAALDFPSEAVSVQEIDRGQSVITIWSDEPHTNDGRITFSGGTYRRGFVGTHQLLAVDFVATNAGMHTFTIADATLLAGDGDGTPIATAATDRSSIEVLVYDENTPPAEIELHRQLGTDLDQDGRVNLRDVSQFLSAWNQGDQLFDFNNDGRMNFTDFSILLADTILN